MINRYINAICVTSAIGAALFATAQPANAFWGHHRRVTTAYALPTVPVTVGYAPVAVARPVFAAPVVAAYAPAPMTTFYAPAPVTTFYAPPATMAAPVTTALYAPAGVVGPPIGGPVTTFYPPSVAAPVTTFYAPPATFYAPPATVAGRPVFWVP